jgi:hypothetical protein
MVCDMPTTSTPIIEPAITDIKKLLQRKFPEALAGGDALSPFIFKTGISSLDSLFPGGSIPYGQLIEITGTFSCGKTSLLLHILSRLVSVRRFAYVDTGNTFFPGAATAAGIDLDRLAIIKPKGMADAIRSTEMMLRLKVAKCVVCDLFGQRGLLPVPLFHRLRAHTVRSKGLVFFVTDSNSQVIPPSMMSLQLTIRRKNAISVLVTVTRSRISREGLCAEVSLYDE